MNTITITHYRKPIALISDKKTLLNFFDKHPQYNNFKRINESLIEYLEDVETMSKTNFNRFIQGYQTCGTHRKALYWTRRGYTEKEAKAEVSKTQKNSSKNVVYKAKNNPRKKEYYINKGFSELEAIEAVSNFQKKNSPRNILYYLSRGLSKSEAKEKIAIFQNNSMFIDYDKRIIPMNLEYWTNRGFSNKEAKEKVKERQTTFSAEILIEKLGKEDGLKKLAEVAKKKRDTFHKRPIEEQDKINTSRGFGINSGWGIQRLANPDYQNKEGILYYIRFYNKDVEFWKIGITVESVTKRFGHEYAFLNKTKLNRDIIFTESLSYKDAFIKEQFILKYFNDKRIKISLNNFSSSECFSENVMDTFQIDESRADFINHKCKVLNSINNQIHKRNLNVTNNPNNPNS